MPSYRAPRIAHADVQAAVETHASAFGTVHTRLAKVDALRAIVPFDQYAFSGLDYPGLGVGAGVMLASDMPEAFLRAYLQRGYMRIDPLAGLLGVEKPWGSWHELSDEARTAPELEPIRMLEGLHGISPRTAFAFYRGTTLYGGMTVTRATPFDARERFILQTAGRDIHADLSADRIRAMTVHAGLSAGEIECLKWAGDGMETSAIAAATGFTSDTVNSYIKSAMRKLNARSRTHAVAEAIRRRLID